jgi:acyl carrier protein
MADAKILSLAEFQAAVAELLEVDESRVTPDASFITDLGADSIRMVEFMLRLEELGMPVQPEMAWQMETVRDAYRLYVAAVSGAGS